MGASAVVASTIPYAVGAALAAKRLNKDQVIIAAFGDGATDESVYHESLNFATLYKLPMIFLVENNSLAVHSRIVDRHSFKTMEHAASYGLPTTHLGEGYDFLKVHNVFFAVAEEVRNTRSPQWIEIDTYRYKEHVGVGDDYDAGYRSQLELDEWQEKDPLIQNKELVNKYRPIIT